MSKGQLCSFLHESNYGKSKNQKRNKKGWLIALPVITLIVISVLISIEIGTYSPKDNHYENGNDLGKGVSMIEINVDTSSADYGQIYMYDVNHQSLTDVTIQKQHEYTAH